MTPLVSSPAQIASGPGAHCCRALSPRAGKRPRCQAAHPAFTRYGSQAQTAQHRYTGKCIGGAQQVRVPPCTCVGSRSRTETAPVETRRTCLRNAPYRCVVLAVRQPRPRPLSGHGRPLQQVLLCAAQPRCRAARCGSGRADMPDCQAQHQRRRQQQRKRAAARSPPVKLRQRPLGRCGRGASHSARPAPPARCRQRSPARCAGCAHSKQLQLACQELALNLL